MKKIFYLLLLVTLKGLSQSNPFFVHGKESIRVPIVFHVLYNENSDNIDFSIVQGQLDTLEKYLTGLQYYGTAFDSLIGNTRIMPVFANKDDRGRDFHGLNNVQTGIDKYSDFRDATSSSSNGIDRWFEDSVLNVWVCVMDSDKIGYASFPGNDDGINGIVINNRYFGVDSLNTSIYNQGKTLVRLFARYFGIRDIDEGVSCSGSDKEDCMLDGDGFCLTPSMRSIDPIDSSLVGRNTCLDEDDLPDMISNIMSEAADSLKFNFTKDQCSRMYENLIQYRGTLINSNVADSNYQFDIRVKDFSHAAYFCNSNVDLKIVVQNLGSENISTYKVEYILNNEIVDTVQYSQDLASGESDSIIRTLNGLSEDLNNLKIRLLLVDSVDQNPYNNIAESRCIKDQEGELLPRKLDFETDNNYVVENPDGLNTWLPQAYRKGANGLVGNCLGIQNFHYNAEGNEDIVFIPKMRVNGNNPYLFIDYAYAKHSSANFEELKIEISSNCFETSTVLFQEEGSHLQTIQSSQKENWFPSDSNQWRELKFSFFPYFGMDIAIKITNTNGYGNNLFIDNILVKDTVFDTSIDEINSSIDLFPNPFKESLSLKIDNSIIGFEIMDIQGRSLRFETFDEFSGTINLPLNDLLPGIYQARFIGENKIVTKKIIKM